MGEISTQIGQDILNFEGLLIEFLHGVSLRHLSFDGIALFVKNHGCQIRIRLIDALFHALLRSERQLLIALDYDRFPRRDIHALARLYPLQFECAQTADFHQLIFPKSIFDSSNELVEECVHLRFLYLGLLGYRFP